MLVVGLIALLATTPVAVRADAPVFVTEDDYPPDALRAEATGITVATISVSANGDPIECKVTRTSTSASLDAATCRVLMRARYVAAHEAGKPVEGSLVQRVRWSLDSQAVVDRVPFWFQIAAARLAFDNNGRPLGCTPIVVGQAAELASNFCSMSSDPDLGNVLATIFGRKIQGETVEFRLTSHLRDGVPLTGVEPLWQDPKVEIASLELKVEPSGVVSACAILKTTTPLAAKLPLCKLVVGRVGFNDDASAQAARNVVFDLSVSAADQIRLETVPVEVRR